MDQIFSCGNEIIKDVLFVGFHAAFMPFAAIFTAATQMRLGIDAAHFHPHQVGHTETDRQWDVEAAISVQIGGHFTIDLQVCPVGDEQGHLCAVFAGKENLFTHVIFWIKGQVGRPEDGLLTVENIQVEDGTGCGKTGKLVKVSGSSPRPLNPITVPIPGNVSSPSGVPSCV